MIDPVNLHPLRAVYPFLINDSRVYRAAVRAMQGGRLSPDKPASLTLNTAQITQLLGRFRLREMTYERLLTLPLSQLSPPEKEFIRFLQLNPAVFQKIARLDGNAQSISARDLVMAAQLAGDALILSPEDWQSIPESVRASDEANAPFPMTEPVLVDELVALLQKLRPGGMHLPDLQGLTVPPAGLNPHEARLFAFLQSPPVLKLLQPLTRPHQGMLLPEVIRVLCSLIWTPAIYGTVPMVFLRAEQDEESAVESVAPVEWRGDAVTGQRPGRGSRRMKLDVHAEVIRSILHKIHPDGTPVTLTELRDYHPSGIEEARAANMLRQLKVFKVLAGQDDQPGTLSEEDIRLVLSEEFAILYDPYLMLVIVP